MSIIDELFVELNNNTLKPDQTMQLLTQLMYEILVNNGRENFYCPLWGQALLETALPLFCMLSARTINAAYPYLLLFKNNQNLIPMVNLNLHSPIRLVKLNPARCCSLLKWKNNVNLSKITLNYPKPVPIYIETLIKLKGTSGIWGSVLYVFCGYTGYLQKY